MAELNDETTIGAFLDALAAGTPTPGGGGAAALMAAVGGAMVSMVCNLTIGRPRYAAVEERIAAVLAEAEQLRRLSVHLIAADAAAYDGVSAALALPKQTDDEKSARKTQLQAALKAASDPPLRIAECAVSILRLCADVAERGNANVLSDAVVGALAARAALDGGALNVRVNLHAIHDAEFVANYESRLSEVLSEGRSLYAATVERTVATTGVVL